MSAGQLIKPLVEPETARHQLAKRARGGLQSLRRLLGRGVRRSRVEILALPCRGVRVREADGKPAAEMVVDGFSRQARWLEGADRLQRTARQIDCEFVCSLTDAEALTLAEQALLTARLARLVRRTHGELQLELGDRLLYPYWVLYVEERSSSLRMYALDAVTGRHPGAEVEQGILRALRKSPLGSS